MKKWMVIGGVCLVLVAVVLVGSGCGSTKVTVNGKTYALAEYRAAVIKAAAKKKAPKASDEGHPEGMFEDGLLGG